MMINILLEVRYLTEDKDIDYNSIVGIVFSAIFLLILPALKIYLLAVRYKEQRHFDPVRRVLGADFREYKGGLMIYHHYILQMDLTI